MTASISVEVSVEVSPGELIDKITILEIKLERIDDAKKLKNIKSEWQSEPSSDGKKTSNCTHFSIPSSRNSFIGLGLISGDQLVTSLDVGMEVVTELDSIYNELYS